MKTGVRHSRSMNVVTSEVIVTLFGTIGSAEKKATAEGEARQPNDVKSVRNLLQAVPEAEPAVAFRKDGEIEGGVEEEIADVRAKDLANLFSRRSPSCRDPSLPAPQRKEILMKFASMIAASAVVVLASLLTAHAEKSPAQLIAEAESAAPASVTTDATIKAADGKVLRKGSNGWTCYPQQAAIGPMCNQPQWDELIAAMMAKKAIDVKTLSVSYMLAGEGTALGVSNIDPYASKPTGDNDWIKEGPHLMITVPDRSILDGVSTDPSDPVYVMWKDTPYAHIMVKIAPEK